MWSVSTFPERLKSTGGFSPYMDCKYLCAFSDSQFLYECMNGFSFDILVILLLNDSLRVGF